MSELDVPRLVLPALSLGASVFGLGVRLRRAAYDAGLFASTRVERPVISAGNITAGGNGKTPFVILLAGMLEARGLRAAILSRGYKSRAERSGEVLIVSRGAGPLTSAREAGDEPVLLAMKTRAAVVVARDRRAAARTAIDALGAEVLLLDDGFQHLALARDLDIVLLDAEHPYGNGALLPRGTLREPPRALDRAHLLALVHHGARATPRDALPDKPAIELEVAAIGPGDLEAKRVALLAAIARPERFERTARALGAEVVHRAFFRDHAVLSREAIDRFLGEARAHGAERFLTTEKDAARLDAKARPPELELLAIEHRIIRGKELLDAALDRVLAASPKAAAP